MAYKLMYIPNDDTQHFLFNYWQKRLDTQLNESTNQNSLRVPKVVKPTNKKRYYKTLETSVIDSLKITRVGNLNPESAGIRHFFDGFLYESESGPKI